MKFLVSVTLMILMATVLFAEGEKPGHHTKNGFQNYPAVKTGSSPGIEFIFKRIWASFFLPDVPEDHVIAPEIALKNIKAFGQENFITWIGQSTFLIQLEGKMILTDPFFAEYAGAYSFGPRRFVPPGISLEALPKIDIIVISHNHFDHLDANSIAALPNKENIHVFVPLGLKNFFLKRGYTHIHELDWQMKHCEFDITFTALPSVHYSGRSLSDKNKTLWCSWAIKSASGLYYFVGDSAYSPHIFKQIGKQFGPFDLAIVTIGTYGNRKYGVNNHTTPEEALQIGLDMEAKNILGMHWGTIEMSEEPLFEPPKRFRQEAERLNISQSSLWIMKIGETRSLQDFN